ncbi:YqcC family protein [Shewanella corallii]|uniref:YqcC family protein n=2 Tax=Shewanella TaxID=22 RepID=A0ABT0N3E0_9GAMM|nr:MULTISPECIES: YqcC family protein [Shewanella]MCL1036355.1 YqcC family protein [Shewanella submarina]MCL2912963.1 YqcC family protein [Shewanella corallii]
MLHQATREYLLQLESELKRQSLWASEAPSPESLASTAPFAVDTLAFEHWLQFIFIPRMQALLDTEAQLPANIAVAPMAHHVWQDNAERIHLIRILNDLDTLLNEPR